jgi:hypothetical protein
VRAGEHRYGAVVALDAGMALGYTKKLPAL